MDSLACPFETLDRLLEEAGNPRFCVVDFHAEATAEKKALGFYAECVRQKPSKQKTSIK